MYREIKIDIEEGLQKYMGGTKYYVSLMALPTLRRAWMMGHNMFDNPIIKMSPKTFDKHFKQPLQSLWGMPIALFDEMELDHITVQNNE